MSDSYNPFVPPNPFTYSTPFVDATRISTQVENKPFINLPSSSPAATPSLTSSSQITQPDSVNLASTSTLPSTTKRRTRKRSRSINKKQHIEQLHRLLRDMVEDKRHLRADAYQRNLEVLKDIAARHSHIREELRKGEIKPFTSSKRQREEDSCQPAPSKRRRK